MSRGFGPQNQPQRISYWLDISKIINRSWGYGRGSRPRFVWLGVGPQLTFGMELAEIAGLSFGPLGAGLDWKWCAGLDLGLSWAGSGGSSWAAGRGLGLGVVCGLGSWAWLAAGFPRAAPAEERREKGK
ncbi:hypothetical protein TIFTF001_048461 [Ficus carica]|uniref:Uncharacterized protein n=1 Tax=Ficus carica TaxID=3494 RepID=A0AA87ZNG6_FICCA|nr:hypothetical protein TIFTF001_048461 [Ficus carica]